MNFSGSILRLGGAPLTVTRSAAGSYDGGGHAQPGATSTLQVMAAVQPVSGREILRLPEGLRTRELIKLYSATQLQTLDDAAKTMADKFAYNGATWEVQHVELWSGFWKCIAARVPA